MEYSIGIDIGGTKIAAGVVSRSGDLVYRQSHSTPRADRHHMLSAIQELVLSCLKFAAMNAIDTIAGIGVGTAGQVDFNRGWVLSGTANIEDWNDVPLRDEISNYTSLPVWIDNDVNVVALGEKYLGAAKEELNVIFLALGTGVGGGVISDGHLLHGAWGSAAELGHTTIDMNGPECNCGLRGCLELYTSGTGIARMMRERLVTSEGMKSIAYPLYQRDPELITSQMVFEWNNEGDPIAAEILQVMIRALAFGIVNFIHTFNPTMIVLGGGVMQNGEWLRGAVEQKVRTLGLRSMVDPVKIRLAMLGVDAGLIGAAYQTWIYPGGSTDRG